MLRSKSRSRSTIAALLLTGALGAVAGASGTAAFERDTPRAGDAPVARLPDGGTATRFGSLADMVQEVGDSVVQISTGSGDSGSPSFDRMFAGPGGSPHGSGGTSQGSGFVIDGQGLVLTNNHVVRGDRIMVTLSDGTELPGRLVGRDEKTDLAVIKVNAERPLKAVRWADSDAARVGENVFAVGSPFGLGNTVTAGIISARGREIGAGPYDDFLQVDASINSGNSGGPLFNAAGGVLGVNTAIFSPSGGNVGIGFAIPARLAQSVVRQLVATGTVSRGRIGAGLQDLTPDVAQALGHPDSKGALIAAVDPSGPAAAAGLRRGDVVVGFEGREIEDGRDFARAVADARIGSQAMLQVARGGTRFSLKVGIEGPEGRTG